MGPSMMTTQDTSAMTLNSASTLISGAVAARAAQRSQLPVRTPCLRMRESVSQPRKQFYCAIKQT